MIPGIVSHLLPILGQYEHYLLWLLPHPLTPSQRGSAHPCTPASTLCKENIPSFNISGFWSRKTTYSEMPHDHTATPVLTKTRPGGRRGPGGAVCQAATQTDKQLLVRNRTWKVLEGPVFFTPATLKTVPHTTRSRACCMSLPSPDTLGSHY